MSQSINRYIITVTARDRVGIIADVSEAVFDLGANIEALSQTVVWGWFTMTTCATFPSAVAADAICAAIEGVGPYRAIVEPFGTPPEGPVIEGEPFIVTVIGVDHPGIVRRLTREFANHGINIFDVWNEVQEGQFIVIFGVTVPVGIELSTIRHDLERAGSDAGVEVAIQHQDIFTATNSLSIYSKPRSISQ